MNLYNIPVQILALDKRLDLVHDLREVMKINGFHNIHLFNVGDGKILSEYDLINKPVSEMPQWGYGKPECKVNHWNAFLSHKEMILRAKKNKWKQFLMVEDDIYLTFRFERVWQSVKNKIPEDFDLLYLGWWIGHHDDTWNAIQEKSWHQNKFATVNKVQGKIGGFHSVIINQSMYDLLLSFPPNNPYDHQLNEYGHTKLRSYYVTPKMTHIQNVHSYCEDTTIIRNQI